jgi:tetratricopeptide (TPR) repeat protein
MPKDRRHKKVRGHKDSQTALKPAEPTLRTTLSLRKQLLFSAIIFVLFFALVEVALALAGVETRLQSEDPFRGFSSLVPVFVREGDTYRTRRVQRERVFNQQSFRAVKPEHGLRIFGLGGSSAYGYPWGAQTAFLSILGDAIAAAHPGRSVETVNAAGMSYAMHRIRIVANEVFNYEPDIIVIYEGHNEFIEPKFFQELKRRSQNLNQLEAMLSRSRLYSFMHRLLLSKPTETSLTDQFDAAVRRDSSTTFTSSEKQEIAAEYRNNLRYIVQEAERRGIRTLVATVPANLRDWRPENSIVETTLSEEQSSRSAEALQLGRRALASRQFDQAVGHLKQALELLPTHAEVHYLLGQAYDGLGQWDAAREAYGRAADHDASPIRRVSQVNAATREVAQSEGALLVDVDKVFVEESEHGLVGLNLIEDYVHPTRAGHQLIAWHLWQAIEEAGWIDGGVTASRETFDNMLARRPAPTLDPSETPVFLTNQARLLANQDKTEQAIEKLREAIRMRPDYPLALYNLGVLLSRSGKAEEGEAQLRQALTRDPQSFQTWNALGTTLLKLKRRQDASQAFQRALDIKPDFDFAWNNLGTVREEMGQHPQAIEAFRRALEINPNHGGFRTNLGNALVESGRLEDAVVELQRAARDAPDSYAALDSLGNALLKAHKYTEAEQRLRTATRLEPSYAPSHTSLGAALLAQGKVEEAIQSLREAVKIAPDDADAKRQLETALARQRK